MRIFLYIFIFFFDDVGKYIIIKLTEFDRFYLADRFIDIVIIFSVDFEFGIFLDG
jgi:hypothetical protein